MSSTVRLSVENCTSVRRVRVRRPTNLMARPWDFEGGKQTTGSFANELDMRRHILPGTTSGEHSGELSKRT